MPSTAIIRALVLEDPPGSLRGLHAPEHGLAVSATCSTLEDATSALRAGVEADAIVVMLPAADDRVAVLRALRPGAALLVSSGAADAATVLDALRLGARGYMTAATPIDRLREATLEACRGDLPMSPDASRALVDAVLGHAHAGGLTDRERDVLTLLAQGHTYPDVARALGIGLGTVQTHVKTIYRKLDIASKAEAAVAAQRLGLV